MVESIVNMKNIKKKYDEQVVFNNFSMEVKRGEFVSVVGESGSGKSTLLNMIGLLDTYDEGEIILFWGRKISDLFP